MNDWWNAREVIDQNKSDHRLSYHSSIALCYNSRFMGLRQSGAEA
jgi:hypothetical protein